MAGARLDEVDRTFRSVRGMIELDRVTKIFGTGDTAVRAVSDLSFTCPRGAFWAIMGPSGCGKSTILASDRRTDAADQRTDHSGRRRPRDDDPRRGGSDAPPAHRLRHAGVQPAALPHGGRERRAAAGARRRQRRRGAQPRPRSSGTGQHRAARRPSSRLPLGRRAATGRHRPRTGHTAGDHAGG